MDIRIMLALTGVIFGMALFVVAATAGLILAEFWRREYDYEDEEEEEAPHQGQDTENNRR